MITLLTPYTSVFIDPETPGRVYPGPREITRPLKRTTNEWRAFARQLAAHVVAPIAPRALVITGRKLLALSDREVRDVIATADGWLLRFDHQQDLWCRTGVTP